MKFKSIATAAAIALLSVSSFAATYNLGALSAGDTFLSGSATTVVSVAKGSFTDTFNFSLLSTSDVDTSIGILNFKKFQITDTSFSYKLFNNENVELGAGNTATDLSISALASGPYHLTVVGVATGANGGHYNGSLTVTPVPEPETFAMLLAGLGLMGTIARRRNKVAAAA